MSMQRIWISDQKIIAQSVFAQPKNFANNKGLPSEKHKNKSLVNEKSFWLGVGAIASVVVAGILITRGKKGIPTNNSGIIKDVPSQKVEEKTAEIAQTFEPQKAPIFETNLRKKISSYFRAFRDEKDKPTENFDTRISLYKENDWNKFKEYLDFRMKNVMFLQNQVKPIPADVREMSVEDVDAVTSFVRNYGYNSYLRNGMNVSKVDEVNRLNRLINEAQPLTEETYVYRGVRTQNLDGNQTNLDFVEDDLEIGDTIIDKAFVSTARSYDTDLASVDPLLLSDPYRNSGYIMRIRLPKGTKGFDCRRLTQAESDRGVNSTFILPPDSEFKIRAFDMPRRILDCEYILPE